VIGAARELLDTLTRGNDLNLEKRLLYSSWIFLGICQAVHCDEDVLIVYGVEQPCAAEEWLK
jgi:hypothetical protein